MKGPFESYGEALSAAAPGEEIWARDSSKAPERKGWCVMSGKEADEYARVTPFLAWVHWETLK